MNKPWPWKKFLPPRYDVVAVTVRKVGRIDVVVRCTDVEWYYGNGAYWDDLVEATRPSGGWLRRPADHRSTGHFSIPLTWTGREDAEGEVTDGSS